MHVRSSDWKFGPLRPSSESEAAWWAMHEPVVDEWLREMEATRDPWWQSAQHAAYCLVSHQEYRAEEKRAERSWDELSVPDFLFHDLHEGGTVGLFGSVEIFFDQLVEALRRFGAAGIVDPDKAGVWLDELAAARDDFIRYYAEDTSDEEADAIRSRHRLPT